MTEEIVDIEPVADDWLDYDLIFEDGVCHAVRPNFAVTVVGAGGQVFHRRAIKLSGGEAMKQSMLVAKLDDVNVYLTDSGLIVSKEDLYL